jgi:hypothetical protein
MQVQPDAGPLSCAEWLAECLLKNVCSGCLFGAGEEGLDAGGAPWLERSAELSHSFLTHTQFPHVLSVQVKRV